MSIEAMKQALEALEVAANGGGVNFYEYAKDLRQAIAEADKQEPVAEVTSETGAEITMSWWHEPALPIGTKLYTTPQQRTWVGLTDEEIKKIAKKHRWHESNVSPHLMPVFRSLEAKLKKKNT